MHRVEDGEDRAGIEATTYQMRNFYRQFADGFFSPLDLFNYVQHHWIAKDLCGKGDRVLDLCCGRGLLLPLLRYHAKPASYTGLDIASGNAVFAQGKRVTDGKPVEDGYYEFPVAFVEGNVADAATLLSGELYDLLVYTSSIEHMHPDAGRASLHAARALASERARLVLTCPNTPEGRSGYETRYRAHVYEWKLSELHAGLAEAGWSITFEWPLMVEGGKRGLTEALARRGLGRLVEPLSAVIPSEWLVPLLSPLCPLDAASEVGLLAVPA